MAIGDNDPPLDKGGRPTKLNDDFIVRAEAYLDGCKDEWVNVSKSDKPHFVHKVNVPTIEGLSLATGIARKTIYNWIESQPSEDATQQELDTHNMFLHIISRLQAEQGQRVLNNGLSGNYNPTIAKLLLSARHNYVEQSKQDITSGGKEIAPIALVRFIGGDDDGETSTSKAE